MTILLTLLSVLAGIAGLVISGVAVKSTEPRVWVVAYWSAVALLIVCIILAQTAGHLAP